jgi:uncharacterized protein
VRFEWDLSKAAINVEKHDGVTFEQASEVFAAGVVALTRFDAAHSLTEARFQTLGPTSRGILLVVWTERHEGTIRIISARLASRAERAVYRDFVKGK